MSWANSSWLWGILVLALAAPGVFWVLRQRQTRFSKFAREGTWKTVIPEVDWSARKRRAVLCLLALLFGFLALARPRWGMHEETVKISGLDILFVLDVSTSMDTEDVVPNRMKKAQHLIRSIAERLGGDRVGLVTFAGTAFLSCPLTLDTDYFVDAVQNSNPKTILNQGTDIGLALSTAEQALVRGAEHTNTQEGSQIVVLVSDGEDLEERVVEDAQDFAKSGIRLFAFGIGSEKGGPIPVRDESGTLVGYKKDAHGDSIISKFRGDTLRKVAEITGGKYWDTTTSEREVDSLVQELGGYQRTERDEKKRVVLEERYQIPLLISIVLLMMEMSFSLRKNPALAVLFLCFYFLPQVAHANGITVYEDNKKGVEAFKKGDLEGAKESFGKAQAQDPSRPELLYNQGVIQMQEKDADGAIQGFSSAAGAAATEGDPSLAARSLYNLGSALASKGQTPQAIQSYLGAIAAAKQAKDEKLEQEARKKIELLSQQQQQQQQSSNQDKKDQSKQDQQNPNKDQNSKNDGGNESGKKPDQDKQNGQSSESQQDKDKQQGDKPFQSQKLTKEDADRVMDELSEKEKALQGKLRRQKVKMPPKEKDW